MTGKDNFEPFDDFLKKYEAFENLGVEGIIKRYSSTEAELKHTIASLIDHRYQERDCELEVLDKNAKKLLKRLEAIHIQRMLEEIYCFKDVIKLQKNLGKNG
jgi:hypothetical protein